MRRVCCLLVLLFTPRAFAAEPWHFAGWQARAVVEIAQPAKTPTDVAGVKVLLHGRGKPDGSDLRVTDTAGKPVPFQVHFLDPARYALFSFRAADAKQRFFVYFANPAATRSPEEIVVDPAPGSGPPKPVAGWRPQVGLTLTTLRRPPWKAPAQEGDKPINDNPRSVSELAKLIADSPGKDGARFQRRISDGYNPFGSSEEYLSIYRGWIHIPNAGKYEFCTASNEASFSFLDGQELVHWPGRHTAARGAHGEVNAAVELSAGPHYVEYYHEEVSLEQMAFLGWRPPGAKYFGPIPEELFPAPHAAEVTRYESPQGPLIAFEPTITDSLWPVERADGQYTRVVCQVPPAGALAASSSYQWDFGDGQTATGPRVEHVYPALGTSTVTLTAGGQTVKWPLVVFELEHVTAEFKEGKPADYARIARGYDRTKLDPNSLKELAHLQAEAGEPAEAVASAQTFVQRFPNAAPLDTARVRRLLADCSIRLGKDKLDDAITHYQASLIPEVPLIERLDTLGRLIRLVGIERHQPDKAGEVFAQVEAAVKGQRLDDDSRRAFQRAVVALGDVLLWQGKIEAAREVYARAERLRSFIPDQVRAARVGSYPNSIREFIDAGNLGAAFDVLDRWDETFPTDKPAGQTLFWRGKLLLLRGVPADAARYLARAVSLGVGAGYETEGRWLLAEALEAMNRPDDARKELAKLVASGAVDEFGKKARAKLQQGKTP